jgi:hypothetical protein
MAEQPNDNYARHDHNHDGVYTPIPTFEEHVADVEIHGGGNQLLDYSAGIRITSDTLQQFVGEPGVTPAEGKYFTAPCDGVLVGVFSPKAFGVICYAVINGIKTAFRSSTSSDYTNNRDSYSIPLSKDDKIWFTGSVIGDDHYFYPYKNQVVYDGDTDSHVYNNMPVGSVCWFKLQEAPDGWVICNGKWYSVDGKYSSDVYTDVCSIETPNLIGRYALGAIDNIGTTVEAGLPNITGTLDGLFTAYPNTGGGDINIENDTTTGAFTRTGAVGNATDIPNYDNYGLGFDASRSNEVYGNSDTVTPPSTRLLPCMKIFNAEETLLMPVPDYSQTIDIMQFPWTAMVSGQIVLSWSIDKGYIVIPCVNGIRICGFADESTAGGYTTTFNVAKDDVVTIEIITSSTGATAAGPEMLSIGGIGTVQGNNQSYILGSYHYVMYARFTPFKNQTITNLAGNVELQLGSHTGVYKAESDGSVTTTDPSKSVTIVKNVNTITMQQTIDGVSVDLTNPATIPSSQSGYVDIGDLRIIYGMTPVISRTGSINQIVRIKLPQPVSALLSVTTTIVVTGGDWNGAQIKEFMGPECTAQVLRVIGNYLYVYVDGHEESINPDVAISYNIFTTK